MLVAKRSLVVGRYDGTQKAMATFLFESVKASSYSDVSGANCVDCSINSLGFDLVLLDEVSTFLLNSLF